MAGMGLLPNSSGDWYATKKLKTEPTSASARCCAFCPLAITCRMLVLGDTSPFVQSYIRHVSVERNIQTGCQERKKEGGRESASLVQSGLLSIRLLC